MLSSRHSLAASGWKQTEPDWVYGRADKSGKHVLLRTWVISALTLDACGAKSEGRAARLRQLKLRPAELYDAVKFDTATWRRAGWPYRHLRIWWCYLCPYPDISLVARRVLCGLGQYPRPQWFSWVTPMVVGFALDGLCIFAVPVRLPVSHLLPRCQVRFFCFYHCHWVLMTFLVLFVRVFFLSR